MAIPLADAFATLSRQYRLSITSFTRSMEPNRYTFVPIAAAYPLLFEGSFETGLNAGAQQQLVINAWRPSGLTEGAVRSKTSKMLYVGKQLNSAISPCSLNDANNIPVSS
jgi:hypothetical protein